MKKNRIVLIVIIVSILILIFGFDFLLKLKKQKEIKISNQITADSSAFITKALDEFNNNKNAKASTVANKIVEEFNQNLKNPYCKNKKAYTYEKNCKACNSVEYFDDENTIIITTYNKKGLLEARTIIKPPSFVTYSK